MQKHTFSPISILPKKIIWITVCCLLATAAASQNLTGLWGVDEVLVGHRIRTPVAKWFRFQDNGLAQSGNGWTQNNVASWTYNEQTKYLLPTNILMSTDPYGGFDVKLTPEHMTWSRMEDGDSVTVKLSRIDQLPMAPADSIQGNWQLLHANPNDPPFTRLQIRPDRLFNYTTAEEERLAGFWHMGGHLSIFSLVSFDQSFVRQVYRVSFQNDLLFMKSEQDSTTLILKRNLE